MTKCDREPASWKVFCRRLCAASRTVSSLQTWIQNEHKRECRWSNAPAAIRSLGNRILYFPLLAGHWLEGEHLRRKDPLCPCDSKQRKWNMITHTCDIVTKKILRMLPCQFSSSTSFFWIQEYLRQRGTNWYRELLISPLCWLLPQLQQHRLTSR